MAKAKLQFLAAMGIFGTIGAFVDYIPLPSATIAFFRGITGVVFLLFVMLISGKRPDLGAIRKNLILLLISGGAIGINWILLFEAYRYTSIATATVCYYLAPVFLLLASPLLGEKLTGKKLLCIGLALVGMVCVSGIVEGKAPAREDLLGIALGVGAALFYASVMLMNKKLGPIPAYDKTVIQLFSAAMVILPYLLFSNGFAMSHLQGAQWAALVVVGIVHTGIAYALYFGAMGRLSAHTIAIFSYVDPVIAIVVSFLMGQPLGLISGIGAALILFSALYSELTPAKSS